MLTRDTNWRQGDLLTQETAARLTALNCTAGEGRRVVVVITHDCDLPHNGETSVEVIVADVVKKSNPQFSYAKNPRKLHLGYEIAGGEAIVIELRHTERRAVPKEEFVKHAARDGNALLPVDAKRALKQWLAARYGRPAFPNAFEDRLRKTVKKNSVERQMGKILEPEAKHLVGLFFDLGEQRSAEVPAGEPYALSISVVYDATEGGTQARQSAEKVAGQLRGLFETAYGKPDTATEIALDACEAVADTSITLADLRRVDQWRLEYISLSDDDHGDFLPVAGTPV